MADETEKTEELETEAAETKVEAVAEEIADTADLSDIDDLAAADDVPDIVEEAATTQPLAPITQLKPKERRAKLRASKAAKTGVKSERTPEERQAERDELRAAKAKARTRRRGQERAKYKASDHERVPTPAREHVVGIQKTRQGVVTSDKAAKTITVRIDDARPHRKYRKIVRTSTTVHAHDESNNAHIGDTVVVQESRPLSATKRWRLVEVVERAK